MWLYVIIASFFTKVLEHSQILVSVGLLDQSSLITVRSTTGGTFS